jgi:hypothetical protein
MSVGNPKLPASSNGDNTDERQPLLVPSDGEPISTITDPEEQRKIDRPDELGWKSYTAYGILLVLGLLTLTLLIKGFIDAGDAEVRKPSSYSTFQGQMLDVFRFVV